MRHCIVSCGDVSIHGCVFCLFVCVCGVYRVLVVCVCCIQGALYQSSHEDENDVQTISHRCEVVSYTDYVQRRHKQQQQQQQEARGHYNTSLYYLAGSYEPIAGRVSFEHDVKLLSREYS